MKDFCAMLSLKTRQGHCYRSVDRTADTIGVLRSVIILYGKVATVVFVGVQLILWSVYLYRSNSRWELLKQPWDYKERREWC